MAEYTELIKALRYCVNARDCKKCGFRINNNSVKCRIQRVEDAAAAIEDLQAEVKQAVKRNAELHAELEKWVSAAEMAGEPKRGEIVRCRECRWGHLCVMGQHLGLDGFCSKGEREVQE